MVAKKKFLGGLGAIALGLSTIGGSVYAEEEVSSGAACTPAFKKLDVSFVIDSTGSMWDDIDNVKHSANSIVDTISTQVPDFRVAVADYKDYPIAFFGDSTDYPYRADLGFTSEKSEIMNAINKLSATGGADWPESVYAGLSGAINAEGLGEWRADAQKAIIIMGDAPPHDLTFDTSYPDKTELNDVIVNAENKGVKIFSVVVGGDTEAYKYFSQISEGTGGKAFSAATASDVSKAILDAVGSIICEVPANSAPDVTGATASVPEIWPPNHKMVPINIMNVKDPDGDPVTITVTKITQDEPVLGKGSGNTAPDGNGIGTDTAYVRSERSGKDNSRVYQITFDAKDDKGNVSTGTVSVAVPHDQRPNVEIVDDGQIYDSTQKK